MAVGQICAFRTEQVKYKILTCEKTKLMSNHLVLLWQWWDSIINLIVSINAILTLYFNSDFQFLTLKRKKYDRILPEWNYVQFKSGMHSGISE